MSLPRIEGYYGFSDEKSIVVNILIRKLRSSYWSVLDVGAGNGSLSRILYERTSNLHLCELSPFYEEKLRGHFPKAHIEILSITNLNLKSYDLIFFSQGLYYHSPSHWNDVVSRLLESVVPGGEMVLILNKNTGDWWEAVRSVWEVYPELLAFSYIPSDQFISDLSNIHKLIDVETFAYNMNFPDVTARDQYLRKSCIPLIQSDVRAENLINEYINKLGPRLNFQYSSEIIALRK